MKRSILTLTVVLSAMGVFAQLPMDKPVPFQQQAKAVQAAQPALTAPSVASAQPVKPVDPQPSFYVVRPTGPSVQNSATAPQLQTPGPRVLTPFTAPAPVDRNSVERVDGMSSQPWARMAGSRPGWSAFPDQSSAQPMIPFFWVGAPPQMNPAPQRGNY